MSPSTKLERLREYEALQAGGVQQQEAARRVGASVVTLWRWARDLKAGGPSALIDGTPTGRKPLCTPADSDIKVLREYYIRTNRAEGKGSVIMAARLAARDGKLSAAVAQAILKPRASKHSIPRGIRHAASVSNDVMTYHRSPTSTRLGSVYVPGALRMETSESGPRRLFAGERQSWDDGSINFCTWVPWPWGGDKCADKFGVKLGRFQLLAGIDDATDFCPGYTYVARAKQSYRGEDSTAAMYRVWRDTYLPKSVMLEGGVWQSARAYRFYEAAGVSIEDAKGRPHKKLVENWWNRLWTVLSLADGQIGRYRGEMEVENDLLMKVHAGSLDPREVFPSLASTLHEFDRAVTTLNAEPVESKRYGRWVPQERHAADLAEHPRQQLEPSLAWSVAPEIHTRKVYRCMVRCRVPSPLGFALPYHFADELLRPFDGCDVTAHFDPYRRPVAATLVLAQDHNGHRAGEIIARDVECLDDAPAVMREADRYEVTFDAGAVARGVEVKRRVMQALVTEYRALGIGGRRLARLSEARVTGGDAVRIEERQDYRIPQEAAGASTNPPNPVHPFKELPRISNRFALVEA